MQRRLENAASSRSLRNAARGAAGAGYVSFCVAVLVGAMAEADVTRRIEAFLAEASKAKVSAERALSLSSAIDLLLDEGLGHLKVFVPGVLEFMVRHESHTHQVVHTSCCSSAWGSLIGLLVSSRRCVCLYCGNCALIFVVTRCDTDQGVQNDRSAAARVCVIRFIMDLSLRAPLCEYNQSHELLEVPPRGLETAHSSSSPLLPVWPCGRRAPSTGKHLGKGLGGPESGSAGCCCGCCDSSVSAGDVDARGAPTNGQPHR